MTNDAHLENLLRQRRSVRRFSANQVPRDLLCKVIEAGAWAPSAGNRQPWEFTVVATAALRHKMAEAVHARWQNILAGGEAGAMVEELKEYSANFDWFSSAPTLIAVSARTPEAFLRHLLGDNADDVAGAKVSAAMAAQNLMLAAHASGLGSCCLTGPMAAQEALKQLLGLGHRQTLVCLIALGYPAEKPVESPRKALSEIMRFIE